MTPRTLKTCTLKKKLDRQWEEDLEGVQRLGDIFQQMNDEIMKPIKSSSDS